MAERLPNIDEETWAEVMGAANAPGGWLRVSHNDDGTHKFGGTPTGSKFLADDLEWRDPPSAAAGSIAPLGLVDAVVEFGLSTANSDAANSVALQAAIDAAGATGAAWIPWPATPGQVYSYDTTLVLPDGGAILGPGRDGSGPDLYFTGGATANGIEYTTGGGALCSRFRLNGFRLTDNRGTATSGSGINIDGFTNGCEIDDLLVRWKTDAGMHLGSSGHTSDNIFIRNVWAVGGTDGIVLEHVNENAVLIEIKGDESATYPMTSLIRLVGSVGAGQSNVIIIGARMECRTASTPTLLQVDSSFVGSVIGMGLMRYQGAGGYVVNTDAATVSLRLAGISGVTSGVFLVRDTVPTPDLVIGDGSGNQRMSRGWIEISHGNFAPGLVDWSNTKVVNLPVVDPHVSGQMWMKATPLPGAVSVTEADLTAAADTTDATSWNTASITPTANRLVLAVVCNAFAGVPTLPTISGCGLTWTQVATKTYDTDTRRLTVFKAMGAAPSASAVTIDFGGVTQTACGWVIAEFAGAGSVLQAVSSSGLSTTPSVTLGTFTDVGNATFGCFGVDNTSAFTVGSGFTSVGTANVAGMGCLIGEWKNSNDTSVDATCTSGNWGGIAVELGGPATNVVTISAG